jgi:uncharacterized membrane protein/mono/diheme cytochrome c family protein
MPRLSRPALIASLLSLWAPAALADSGVPVPVALLGRLHFPLLHFPIALLCAVVVVELFGGTRLDAQKKKDVASLLLLVAAVSAVVTAVSGLAYAQGAEFSASEADTFALHRGLGLAVAGISVALAAIRRGDAQAPAAALYRPLLVIGALGVLVTGHEGGELVHGEGFLTRPLRPEAHGDTGEGKGHDDDDAPRAASDGDEGSGATEARTRHPEVALVEKPDYVTHIKPIFERSCVKCHGPEKRKSGLRLDEKRFAMKGGESGPAIVAGDPAKSIVFTSCSAPADDEDVMPPKGKLLALSEIELMKRWIEQGAVWPDAQP